ncbi:hypothetical protein FOZ60_000715 [Perkinsus olseni]|uniref:Uncharacterized protein n=1 Tax=Perkinsus olseni TaxID=32597 RepID=A0A7J6P2S5_PEROL|nr:hypothetical protein FOZ60_000715 [Perkinsus olseni]
MSDVGNASVHDNASNAGDERLDRGGPGFAQPAEFAVQGDGGDRPAAVQDAAQQPAEAAVAPAAGLAPGSEAALPAAVVAFITSKLSPDAQYDVSSVLVQNGITSPELLAELDDCNVLAAALQNPINIFALRAIAKLYRSTDAGAGTPNASNGTPQAVSEAQVQAWLRDFESKHSVRVPARWRVSPKVMCRLRKDEHVREEDCAYVAGSKAVKRKVKFDFESGDIEATMWGRVSLS